jgi:hypothetical protein
MNARRVMGDSGSAAARAPTLLILADAAGAALRAALSLGAAWRSDTRARVELWGPAQVLESAPVGAVDALHALAAGNPGASLWLALGQSLATGQGPVLMRAACPGLTLAHAQQTLALLSRYEAVFATTAEGGYAMVGLRRALPELFAGIPWGTDQVMAATRARARKHGLSLGEFALGSVGRD